jgi:hypothetical protein
LTSKDCVLGCFGIWNSFLVSNLEDTQHILSRGPCGIMSNFSADICANIYPLSEPNVGPYSIHGAYGSYIQSPIANIEAIRVCSQVLRMSSMAKYHSKIYCCFHRCIIFPIKDPMIRPPYCWLYFPLYPNSIAFPLYTLW